MDHSLPPTDSLLQNETNHNYNFLQIRMEFVNSLIKTKVDIISIHL